MATPKGKDDDEYEEEVPVYMQPRPPTYRGHNVDPTLPTYKIVMLGARGTGKTCMFAQFTYAAKASIVITPRTRTIMMDDVKMNVEVWDVPGKYQKDREEWTQQQSYPGAHAFIIAYSKVKEDALDMALTFIRKIEAFFAEDLMRPEIMLVGTYADKPKETHKIDWLTGRAFAEKHNCLLMETSVWDLDRCNFIFAQLTAHLVEMYHLEGYSEEIPEDEDDVVQKMEREGKTDSVLVPVPMEIPEEEMVMQKALLSDAEQRKAREDAALYGKRTVPLEDRTDRPFDRHDALDECWVY